MRRVLILILLLALVGVAAVAFLLGGDDGGGTTDETPIAGNGDNGDGGGGNNNQATTPTPNLIPVVIALQDINRGTLITEDLVQVRFWPDTETQDAVFAARLQSTDEVVGRYARTDIPVYSPVVRAQLVDDPASLGRTGSDVANLIANDRLGIAIPLDPTGIGQAAYGLQPGDWVDIIMTFAFVDVDEFFQTRLPDTLSVVATTAEGGIAFTPPTLGNPAPNLFELDFIVESETGPEVLTLTVPGSIGPSEKIQRPRLITQRIIQGAKVLYVGWLPEDGKIYGQASPTPFVEISTATPVGTPPPPEGDVPDEILPTATPFMPMIAFVEFDPQDAVLMAWAIESGIPFQLAMRSARAPGGDNGVAQVGGITNGVSLGYLLSQTQYGLPDPNTLRLTYSLEPRPIIRRFDLSSLRQFVSIQSETATDQSLDPLREDLLREDLFIGSGGE